jgi:hypothetical protein
MRPVKVRKRTRNRHNGVIRLYRCGSELQQFNP